VQAAILPKRLLFESCLELITKSADEADFVASVIGQNGAS
jgi:hypothetical protein